METAGAATVKTFVLIHGASHGGWCYERIATILRSQGHRVFTPTLADLAERSGETSPQINLTTHINAVVPESGKCMNDYVFPGWKLIPILLAVWLLGRGYKLTPPPPAWYFKVNKADQAMVNRLLTAHPFASLQEKIKIGDNLGSVASHTYVYATKFDFAPITEQYQRAKARRGWNVFEVESGHDIMLDAPEKLADIQSSLP